MGYFRPGLSGLQSQPPGGRVASSALGGVQSQPPGRRVHRGALGAAANEYTVTATPPPPPPPPPSRVMGLRGRVGPRWYRQLQGTTLGGSTLGADDPTGNTLSTPTLSEPDTTVIRRIDSNVSSLVTASALDEKRRKTAMILTGVGLVFAAIKLGVLAIPHLRKSHES